MANITCVIDHFYPYFWHKFKFYDEDNAETECPEVVNQLREAVWVHRIVSLWHWRPFFRKNLLPMISSPETYLSYIFFIVSTTIKDLPSRHESFMTSCSLVTGVAAYVYDKGFHEFLDYCPTILTVIFEEYHKKEFEKCHSWNSLQDYLIHNRFSDAYEMVEEETRGDPFADAVNDSHFVEDIKDIIKSKISVRERAAVFRHTEEVIRRFNKLTSPNGPFTGNRKFVLNPCALSPTQDSLKNAEEARKEAREQKSEKTPSLQSKGKTFQSCMKRLKTETTNISEMCSETLKLLTSQSPSPVKPAPRSISTGTSSSQSKRYIKDSKSEPRISAEDNEHTNLTIVQSHSLEQLLQINEQRTSESEQSSAGLKDIEAVCLKRISSPKSEPLLQERGSEKISDKEQSSAKVEDGENVDLMISPFYSEEQLLQKIEKSNTSTDKEKVSAVEGSEIMGSKWNLPSQSEESCQENMEKSGIFEREQSLSIMEGTIGINLEQTKLSKSEQFFQSDTSKLEASDSQPGSPVEPTLDIHSDEKTSKIEANYSNTPHEHEAKDANENTSPLSKEKNENLEKRKKSVVSELEVQEATKPEISEKEYASAEEEGTETIDKTISEEQSLQQGKPRDTETIDKTISEEQSLQQEGKPRDTETIDKTISEEQSLQHEGKPGDTEASVPVPDKQEAVRALVFLIAKLNDTLKCIIALFESLE